MVVLWKIGGWHRDVASAARVAPAIDAAGRASGVSPRRVRLVAGDSRAR